MPHILLFSWCVRSMPLAEVIFCFALLLSLLIVNVVVMCNNFLHFAFFHCFLWKIFCCPYVEFAWLNGLTAKYARKLENRLIFLPQLDTLCVCVLCARTPIWVDFLFCYLVLNAVKKCNHRLLDNASNVQCCCECMWLVINERYNLIVFNLHHMANYHWPDSVSWKSSLKSFL